MQKEGYSPRIIEKKVEEYLETFGAVNIVGAKFIGKTWTAEKYARSEFLVADPAGNFNNRRLAETDPSVVLPGERPRLIDEWQDVPPIWDAVRFEVDKTQEKGKYILTGSATPKRKGIRHSGAGRIGTLRMRPMSLYEEGFSSGDVSLEELCSGRLEAKLLKQPTLDEIVDYIIRGGWPANRDSKIERASLLPESYINAVLEHDIHELDDIERDVTKMTALMKSLARNESTTVSLRTLQKDMEAKDGVEVSTITISAYLDALSRLFILDNQPPFSSSLRSSVRVRQQEKRHFSDPSLAAALLKADRESLLGDLETLGLLFEALCVRDLRIYAESFGGSLSHYQDYNNREIDAVVSLPGGEWCAFEIKLGANRIDEAAANLGRIQKEIEKDDSSKKAKVLCVISGLSNAAYRRADGVFVVPVTALRP